MSDAERIIQILEQVNRGFTPEETESVIRAVFGATSRAVTWQDFEDICCRVAWDNSEVDAEAWEIKARRMRKEDEKAVFTPQQIFGAPEGQPWQPWRVVKNWVPGGNNE